MYVLLRCRCVAVEHRSRSSAKIGGDYNGKFGGLGWVCVRVFVCACVCVCVCACVPLLGPGSCCWGPLFCVRVVGVSPDKIWCHTQWQV